MLTRFNEIGWTTTASAFLLNLGKVALKWEVNEVLTVLISILSLVYLVLKIINQLMINRREKRIAEFDMKTQEFERHNKQIKEALSQTDEKPAI